MKYPYIGKLKSDNSGIVLFCSDSFGAQLNCKGSGWRKDDIGVYSADDDWDEDKFKNITTEYLANTYGEVKSKEHAHFIVELSEGAGYELVGSVSPNNAGVFVFDGENKTLFFMLGGSSLRGGSVLKQITIPLPPECESVDEWPKVGDEVVTNSGKGVVKLPPDNSGFYVVSVAGEYLTLKITAIQKPKTPEQELRDELSDLAFNQFNDDSYDLTHNSYYLAEQLISKYNITKKPQ